jgi:hypothetical protein
MDLVLQHQGAVVTGTFHVPLAAFRGREVEHVFECRMVTGEKEFVDLPPPCEYNIKILNPILTLNNLFWTRITISPSSR